MTDKWSFQFRTPEHPEGKLIELSNKEAEKMLLERVEQEKDKPDNALWQLARFYSFTNRHDEAMACVRRIVDGTEDLEKKAACFLAMGGLMEQMDNYEAAIEFYREAFTLEPRNTRTWYFIHNNLGYCLNILGRYDEGERYCRSAIAIDARRANAYKNLGIALYGQEKIREAAQSFVRAVRVNAGDARSLVHLKALLEEHPDLRPEFETDLEHCRKAVEFAARQITRFEPKVQGPWGKRITMFRIKMRSIMTRINRRFHR